MKIKDGFELRMICGESIVMAVGKDNADFTKLLSLNDSAALIWNELVDEDEFTLDDMVEVLLDNYEVEEETARQDCEDILDEWKSIGVVEE